MSNEGKKVRAHYRGTFNDGVEFDSSYKRNQPLEFTCGAGQMIKGFDEAVKHMTVGETVNIHLEPKDAYGEIDPELIVKIPREHARGIERFPLGSMLAMSDGMGGQFPARLISIDDAEVTVDLNSEMAGKALNFEITLVSAE